MIHGKATVIAAKRNKKRILVYIPEKIRRGKKLYVQPYKLHSQRGHSNPITVSIDAEVHLSVRISTATIVMTSPFSAGLLKTYMDLVATTMKETAHTAFEIGKPGRKDERESWDADYLSVYASITPV